MSILHIKCKYKKVSTIVKKYGLDWSNLIINDVDFEDEDLRKITLPRDKDLFQRIKGKSLMSCILPNADYSEHNFNDVDLRWCTFTEYSLFPKDKEIFQKINKKSLLGCKLPYKDFSEYSFNNVLIENALFSISSKIPNNRDFFQNNQSKSIWKCSLPAGDYSGCDFRNINIMHAAFTEDSKLPMDRYLFQLVFKKSARGCSLPNQTIRDIHLYDLNNVDIDLTLPRYLEILTTTQISILKILYGNQINVNIKIPKKSQVQATLQKIHEVPEEENIFAF